MASMDIEESVTQIGSVSYRLQHKLVIDDFSLFYADPLNDTESVYPEISSASFSSSQDSRFQFKLLVKPKGESVDTKDWIGVYLFVTLQETAKPTMKVKVSIQCYTNKYCLHEKVKMFTSNASIAWPRFTDQEVCKRYLLNDKLTFVCEVEIYPEPFAISATETSLKGLEADSMMNNSKMYGALLNSGDYSDLTLMVGGEEVKAHKAILSAHSPVFKAMLEADMKEKEDGRVEIDDLTIDMIWELLEFIYTGKVDITEENAEGLLQAADKYGIIMLKRLCGQFLCDKVNIETAAFLLALADRHSTVKLKNTCVKFIRAHMTEVALTNDWPLVDKLFIEELRQLAIEENRQLAIKKEAERVRQLALTDRLKKKGNPDDSDDDWANHKKGKKGKGKKF